MTSVVVLRNTFDAFEFTRIGKINSEAAVDTFATDEALENACGETDLAAVSRGRDHVPRGTGVITQIVIRPNGDIDNDEGGHTLYRLIP